MCGRFVGFRKLEELAQYFPIDASDCDVSASYNIAPEEPVLAIHRHKDRNRLDRFNWGLVPFWAKSRSIGRRMINARAETVALKPSFKNAFKRQRCLIPADGFYEWSGAKGQTQPYFFKLPDGRPFAFAGIWDVWKDSANPEAVYRSCAIITTEADASFRKIHHRMPVILNPEVYDAWLDSQLQDVNQLTAILTERPVNQLVHFAVSIQVNTARNNDISNIKPLTQMTFDF